MSHPVKSVKKLIDTFRSFEKKHPGLCPDTVTFDFKKHAGHIVFSGIIHGNEVGSLQAMIDCIEALSKNKIRYFGKVTFLLGNANAALQNKRFLESDLNRAFGKQVKENSTTEHKRAQELLPLIQNSDVFIDFHQTIMPCHNPFYIFAMQKPSYFWARALGGTNIYITRKSGVGFSKEGLGLDEMYRLANKVGVTLELGEQGFHNSQHTTAVLILTRALKTMDKVYLHKFSIKKLAHKNQDFKFLEIIYREPFDNEYKQLKNGLYNFYSAKKNEVLGKSNKNSELLCKDNGYILFPKYPTRNVDGGAIAPYPSEIFSLARSIKVHPLKW